MASQIVALVGFALLCATLASSEAGQLDASSVSDSDSKATRVGPRCRIPKFFEVVKTLGIDLVGGCLFGERKCGHPRQHTERF